MITTLIMLLTKEFRFIIKSKIRNKVLKIYVKDKITGRKYGNKFDDLDTGNLRCNEINKILRSKIAVVFVHYRCFIKRGRCVIKFTTKFWDGPREFYLPLKMVSSCHDI